MTDQIELLQAISDQPDDDILRLAYVDWLKENRLAEPNTEATCEFIEVSCGLRKSSQCMPHKAYKWLDGNWQRLIPRVMAHHKPFTLGTRVLVHGNPPRDVPADGGPLWDRSGRKIWCKIRLNGHSKRRNSDPNAVFGCSMSLTFWKGFVQSYLMFSDWGRNIIKDDMLLDQPHLGLIPATSVASAPLLGDDSEPDI